MKKEMNILYPVHTGLYINLTNRCPCACTFCIRQKEPDFYTKDSLWLDHEPTFEDVKAALLTKDLDSFTEFVFCGFGEPTEALDVLVKTAAFIKSVCNKPVRLNTNGLGNLVNKKDIIPSLKGLIDAISISLNSSNPEIYEKNVRPKFKNAHAEMISFAEEAAKIIPSVTMTTVSTTITKDDEEKCRKLCEKIGVKYRIRDLI